MGERGPKPKETCINGHDLTKSENIATVKRKRKGRIYKERQCVPCRRKRSREWWRKNRGSRTDS